MGSHNARTRWRHLCKYNTHNYMVIGTVHNSTTSFSGLNV
jgi:hypothetical protein